MKQKLFNKENIVEISFYIEGKEFTKKDGSKGFFNKNVIIDMKHADKQVKKTTKDSKLSFEDDNKIPVTAMSDIDKIAEPPEENPFPDVVTNTNPVKIDANDDMADDDMPF